MHPRPASTRYRASLGTGPTVARLCGVALMLSAMLTAGCESSAGSAGTGPQPPQAPVSSGTPLEQLFPMVDRAVYQWAMETDEGQDVLMGRVTRHSPTSGSLQLPGGTKQFEYVADGVRLVSQSVEPVYVLKQPVAVGTSWRGEHGGTVEIVRVDAVVEVPAGRFTGCVQTLETRGGDRPIRVATTYCPDTGIVLLEAAAGGSLERAELKSYGPPVDIGPDGVRRLE